MKKLSFIALAVSTALVGCGGDDSASHNPINNDTQKVEKTSIAIPTQGEFIDAKVEGLYYVSGSESGKTNADGTYKIDTNADNVTFILGGEFNGEIDGLVIGHVSPRDITTPFEAAGTYQRSINLARLLLTINDSGSDASIVIPDAIQSPNDETVIDALKQIKLDDDFETSAQNLLKKLGKQGELVSEDEAKKHIEGSLNGLKRGSDDKLAHWAKGSNWTFVERSAKQRVKNGKDSDYQLVIHADRTLGDKVFKETVGLSGQTFTTKEEGFIVHAGSNDSTLSGKKAAKYLTCVKQDGAFTRLSVPDSDDQYLCNGGDIKNIEIHGDLTSVAHNSSGAYQLSVIDPTKRTAIDNNVPWSYVATMGGVYQCMADANCSEQTLSQFEVVIHDDSDKQDGSKMLEETLSGSYDPVADVYVQTRRKKHLDKNDYPGRVAESVRFIYPVAGVGQDRYVDFQGTWRVVMTRPGCDKVAEATLTFDADGLTANGKELNSNNGRCYLADWNETETVSYQDLANRDFWWFTTNAAGASKATLDQLNTTIRWNDRDEDDTEDNFKINRFSYMPAGKNWDRGLLVRDTLDSDGNKRATATLRKIK